MSSQAVTVPAERSTVSTKAGQLHLPTAISISILGSSGIVIDGLTFSTFVRVFEP